MRCPARVTWRGRRHDRGGNDRPVALPRPEELPADGPLVAGRVLLDERSAALASRIDAAFLAEAGWGPGDLGADPAGSTPCWAGRSAAPRAADHLRRSDAGVPGLPAQAHRGRAGPGGRRAAASAARQALARHRGWDMPGYRCPRPWVMSGQPLCPEHLDQRERLGVSIAGFTARPDVAHCPRIAPARWHRALGRSPGTMPSTATRTCSGCVSCAAPASTLTRRRGGSRAAGPARPAGQPCRAEPASRRRDAVRAAAAHPARRQDLLHDPAASR